MSNPSVLFQVWSNLVNPSKCYVFQTTNSDHMPSITIIGTLAKPTKQLQKLRDFSKARISVFDSTIESQFIKLRSHIHIMDITDSRLAYLSPWLIKKCSEYFPIKQRWVSRKHYTSPWITPLIIKLIRKKHSIFALVKKDKILLSVYNEYCKKLKTLLRISENMYHQRRFKSLKISPR